MATKKQSTVNAEPSARLRYFESRLDSLVQTIRELAEIESPSDNKSACDRISAILAEKFALIGGRPQLHRAEEYGDNLQIDFPGSGNSKPVLLLGHFDTVYPLGTLAKMPCIFGPGICPPSIDFLISRSV